MDAVNVTKGVSSKIAEVEMELIKKMSPALQEVLELDADWKAKNPSAEQRKSAAEEHTLLMIITNALAIARLHGYSDTAIENLINEAQKLEAQNAKAIQE